MSTFREQYPYVQQAHGELLGYGEGNRASQQQGGAVAERFGQFEVVTAAGAVQELGDDDQFGEPAGGVVE